MKHPLYVMLATLGPLGYFPAPGTVATLATLLLVYALSYYHVTLLGYTILLFIISAIAIIISGKSAEYFFRKDPQQVVIDELVGTLVTFWAVPVTMQNIILGFILFRLFDIVKPLGIKKCENLSSGLGIVMDDVVAALYSAIILRIIILNIL